MSRLFQVGLIALSLALGGLSGTPAQSEVKTKTIDTTQSTSLSPEKQARIKEFVRQQDRMKEAGQLPKSEQSFTVGAVVPSSIELVALPEDASTEVPQVTSYRFFLAANGIVMVDPESRKVIQVIQ
jgi:hypothetical protein